MGRANLSLAADRFLHSSKSAPRKNTIIKHSLQQGSSTELGQHLNSGKPLENDRQGVLYMVKYDWTLFQISIVFKVKFPVPCSLYKNSMIQRFIC